jgi:Glycosyl hydrolase family 12
VRHSRLGVHGARWVALSLVAGASLAVRDARAGTTFDGYTTTGTVAASTGTNWAEYTYDTSFTVENNQWGIPSNGQGSSTIFTETVNNQPGFGWAYDITSGTGVTIFPEVGYGWTPNGNVSWGGNPVIPQLSENQSITATFQMASQHSAGSTWDFAYDIWITSASHPSSTTGSYELMIWLDHENQGPWSTQGPQGLVTIDGVSYQRYTNSGAADWTCLSYVNQGAGIYQSSNFSISDVVNDAASKFGISSSFYVASIEFGNEVVVGSGMTEIFQWQIDVSTSAPDAGAPPASDAGSTTADAGAVDAGADGSGGSVDSGTAHDAAAADASGHDSGQPVVAADASTSAGGESDTSGGNAEGCSLGAAALGDWGFVLLVGVGVVVSRRKRR